jgi:hypothetical protein
MSSSTASSTASSPTRFEQTHPSNLSSSNVVFTVPNMNHKLNIELSNSNFTSWRTQILACIKGQDTYGFLDGTSQPPAQTIPNSSTAAGAPATMANPKYLAWCQQDQMIFSVLISTLTEPLVVHAVGCPTSHNVLELCRLTTSLPQPRKVVLPLLNIFSPSNP